MEKSPDAFRTISEVADELDLPQHVLRFWESKFSQIKPMKRGGGRRYYRPGEIELLRGIRHLLYTEGYTIKGVQKILREQGARQVVNFLQAPSSAGDTAAGPRVESPDERARSNKTNAETGAKVAKKTIRNLKSILASLKEARQMIDESRRNP
ncbi:MAG: MerR family transcriptional regulator [Fimbriimonadaceae bacterium]|nr:MerR family transcriptional regulator [Alphaproteobacteria bacterium]